jgi:hypothetical protein
MATLPLTRFSKLLIPIIVAVTVIGLGGATQTDGKTERFTATAVNIEAPPGAVATPVDILVSRWSTDTERDRLLTTMMESGPERLLDVLREMPRVGSIRTPDSIGYDLHFARRTPGADGAERVVIMTDRPIGFWEARNQPRTIDYPFTVIELRIGSNGRGEGKMSIGTKITADKEDHTVVLENWAAQPVMLNDVRREK